METDDDTYDDAVTGWLDRLDEDEEERRALLQYHDGSWCVVDETGWPSEPVMLTPAMLEGSTPLALRPSAIDVDPESVTDTEHSETPGEGDYPR